MEISSLNKLSGDYKKFILVEFVKQIMKINHNYKEKIEEDLLKEKVSKIIQKRTQERLEQQTNKERKIQIPSIFKKQNKKLLIAPQKSLPMLKIPLPLTVRHIRPIPYHPEIDLKKLQPFVKDPTVTAIIIKPNENVIVKRGIEKRQTQIILSLEEIDQIIETFAQLSKIPIENFYKVVVGNLELNAIDPRGQNPKLIITKIHPMMRI